MPTVYRLQSNFTKGVLDPRMASRTDVDAYYGGVAVGENVTPIVQGGLKRRSGLEFIDDLGTGVARLIPFEFNTEQEYLFVMTNLQVEVFKDGVSQALIVTPWVAAELFDVRFTQSADTMILVHEDHAPRKIVRGATHTSWTLSTISFANIPQWYYNDALSPAGTDEIQQINMGAINPNNDFVITLEGQTSPSKTYPAEVADTANVLEEMLLALSNTPNTGITVVWASAELFDVTFSGPAADAWGLMSVKEVNTGSDVGSVTRTQTGAAETEDIMSATRGWPRTVTFHEGRLWFGGFKSLPQTILGSRVADFFNLDTGTARDDEAILGTIDTDQVNAVQAIYSGRQLQIFTTGGEFIAPTVESRPLTPSTITIRRQTRHGSTSVQPVSIDGATIFIDRSGKVLRDFVFNLEEDSYTAPSLSVLASDLISQPVDMDELRGSSSEQSNYVYIVNADGTIAVFNLLRDQNVIAFTKWTTDGLFESVTVLDDTPYFIVNRDGNRMLECLNSALYFDHAVEASSIVTTTASGFDHLDGMDVRALADGTVQGAQTVVLGDLEFAFEPAEVQAGLDFTVTIKTMPLNVDFGNGPTLSRRKRFVEASLLVYESLGLLVDGHRIPDTQFGEDVLDDAPIPFTGMKQAYVHGWTDIAQLTITQTDPLPMTLTGLVLEVEAV